MRCVSEGWMYLADYELSISEGIFCESMSHLSSFRLIHSNWMPEYKSYILLKFGWLLQNSSRNPVNYYLILRNENPVYSIIVDFLDK